MKLITVNVYNVLFQAEVARNALVSAGIWSVLQDADVVGIFGGYSNAIGGVKLQVRDHDVEHVLEVLRDFEHGSSMIDAYELTRQALEASPESKDQSDEDVTESVSSEVLVPVSEPSEWPEDRDAYALKFFQLVVFNFFIPLLTPYAFYLLLNAAFGTGSISDAGRWRIACGTGMLLMQPLFWLFLYFIAIHLR